MGHMIEDKLKELKAIFAQRLQNARKMRGLSQAQLAERLNGVVTSTAIEKYEKGEMMPRSSATMVALAEALNTRVDDLLRPFNVLVDCSKFEFRKKAKLGKKAIEAIKLTIQLRIDKYLQIERIAGEEQPYDISMFNTHVVNEEDARRLAIDIRKEWELGMGPISQPIQVLESKGVKVIEVNIDADPSLFDGTSNMVEGIPVLVINKASTDEERKRLTLFHEFGHQVMKFNEDISDKMKETLCNVFANEMLLPSETFHALFGSKRQIIANFELADVRREYGISIPAIMMKAKQLGVVNESRYRWFCIQSRKQGPFQAFVNESVAEPMHTTRFERLVYRCLSNETISTSFAANMLNISVGEVISNYGYEM